MKKPTHNGEFNIIKCFSSYLTEVHFFSQDITSEMKLDQDEVHFFYILEG